MTGVQTCALPIYRIKCHNLTYFPKTAITQYAVDHHLLTQKGIARLEQGDISDFFHGDAIRDRQLKTAKEAFSKCYKWLPILPAFIIRRLIRSGDSKWFGAIPGPVIILGQLLVAVKGRDYRFLIYLKYYPLRIKRSLKRMLAG